MAIKTTGNPLTPKEITQLKRGDVYFNEIANAPRCFDHFSNQGNIVNTDGKLNKIENVRWLTQAEKSYWASIMPDLFKIKPNSRTVGRELIDETQPQASDQGTKNMNNTSTGEVSFTELFKGDLVEAGYRVAATQVGKGVKGGLVLALEKQGMGSEKAAIVKEFLETELGSSLINALLGVGLQYTPGLKDDPRVEKLASVLRVDGMAIAGNVVIGSAMEYILPAIQEAMKSLPALPTATKTRVPTKESINTGKNALVDLLEEEKEEEATEPKRATA